MDYLSVVNNKRLTRIGLFTLVDELLDGVVQFKTQFLGPNKGFAIWSCYGEYPYNYAAVEGVLGLNTVDKYVDYLNESEGSLIQLATLNKYSELGLAIPSYAIAVDGNTTFIDMLIKSLGTSNEGKDKAFVLIRSLLHGVLWVDTNTGDIGQDTPNGVVMYNGDVEKFAGALGRMNRNGIKILKHKLYIR